MIMATFAERYDFSGKTVFPVVTHAVSGLGNAPDDYERLCDGARIGEGLAVRGEKVRSARPQVDRWLRQTGLRDDKGPPERTAPDRPTVVGGYSLKAAQSDKRFKTVATVSMFNSARVRRNGLRDSALDTIQERLRQASAARAQEAAGGEVLYAGDADITDQQIAAPVRSVPAGLRVLLEDAVSPCSTFKYTMSSLLDPMAWYATIRPS